MVNIWDSERRRYKVLMSAGAATCKQLDMELAVFNLMPGEFQQLWVVGKAFAREACTFTKLGIAK